METSTMPAEDLRSRVGKLALAIGFAFALGAVGVRPAMAGAGGHDHGDNGRHQEQRHDERHDNGRHDDHQNYYAPPTYYVPPNYDYAPPPVYYDAPPPPSEGWTFIFP
jgi:hypothetical protein